MTMVPPDQPGEQEARERERARHEVGEGVDEIALHGGEQPQPDREDHHEDGARHRDGEGGEESRDGTERRRQPLPAPAPRGDADGHADRDGDEQDDRDRPEGEPRGVGELGRHDVGDGDVVAEGASEIPGQQVPEVRPELLPDRVVEPHAFAQRGDGRRRRIRPEHGNGGVTGEQRDDEKGDGHQQREREQEPSAATQGERRPVGVPPPPLPRRAALREDRPRAGGRGDGRHLRGAHG